MKKIILSFCLPILILTCGSNARADYTVDYYQINQDIPGLTLLRVGHFRDKKNYDLVKKDRTSMEAKGYIFADKDKKNTITKEIKFDKHVGVIKLNVFPPSGSGMGGGNYIAQLEVIIDGISKIKLPFGYVAFDKTIKEVAIHHDGWLDVLAYDEKGRLLELPFEFKGFGNKESLRKLINDASLKVIE